MTTWSGTHVLFKKTNMNWDQKLVHLIIQEGQQLSFYWQLAQEENNIHEKESSDEDNYLTDTHYEQEKFTDRYNEYFEDDENKAERFTDDYHEDFTDQLVDITSKQTLP